MFFYLKNSDGRMIALWKLLKNIKLEMNLGKKVKEHIIML